MQMDRSIKADKKDHQNKKLVAVDPYADDGVWAIVDGACNSTRHSSRWKVNAAKRWQKKGLQSFLKDPK
eukprot:8865806-Karenia_brevis.AAC.1